MTFRATFLSLESDTSLHIAFIHLALLKNSPTDFLKNALKTTYYKPGVFEECILGSADDRAKSNIFNYILRQINFEFDMKDSLIDLTCLIDLTWIHFLETNQSASGFIQTVHQFYDHFESQETFEFTKMSRLVMDNEEYKFAFRKVFKMMLTWPHLK